MKKMFATTKSRVITGVVALFVLLLASASVALAYYGSHALPGTTVAGHPVGGQTREQVAQTIESLRDSQVVELEDPKGGVFPVDFAEAGVFVDVPKSVDQVFHKNRDLFTRIAGLFGGGDIEPAVVTNYAQLDSFLAQVEGTAEVEPVDAEVKYDDADRIFVVTAGVEGVAVDMDLLQEQVIAAAASLDSQQLQVLTVAAVPTFSTEAAQAAADAANKWLTVQVQTSDGDGSIATAEPAVLASWVSFETDGDQIAASIDQDAVRQWVDGFAQTANRDVVNGQRTITESGELVGVGTEGSPGRRVTNQDAIATAIVTALHTGSSYTGEFAYEYTEPTYEDRVIADGAQNLAYWAAPGEKWIDIDLTNHRTTAYEGATAVMSMPMVQGAPLTPTLTGTYSVYAKLDKQDMKGKNVDGTSYETKDVPWVLYYDGNYALHGAYWRSSFGYDAGAGGSHGCVNLPVDKAKQLYDWARIGTTVVSRY